MSFAELGSSEPILQAVKEANSRYPYGDSAKAIPLVLAGKDVIGAFRQGLERQQLLHSPLSRGSSLLENLKFSF